MLRRRGRVSYRALKVQFQLDNDLLALLRDEIVEVHQLARDQEGTMLVWTGRRLAPRPYSPPSLSLRQLRPLLPRQNAGSSRSSSVIWWTRPPCPASSTRKTCARLYGPIETPAPR